MNHLPLATASAAGTPQPTILSRDPRLDALAAFACDFEPETRALSQGAPMSLIPAAAWSAQFTDLVNSRCRDDQDRQSLQPDLFFLKKYIGLLMAQEAFPLLPTPVWESEPIGIALSHIFDAATVAFQEADANPNKDIRRATAGLHAIVKRLIVALGLLGLDVKRV